MSGFYIDTRALQALRHALGATQSQMTAAFNKALRQTVNAMYKQSVNLMLHTTGAKNRKVVQGRMRRAVKAVGSSSKVPGSGRIWFGLDDMPVSSLRGSIKNPRGIRPQNRKRDALGRFLPAKGARGATFSPSGASELHATSFKDSFVAALKGKRSIWIRTSKGHITEARMPVYDPMVSAIGTDINEQSGEMLMEFFRKDLAGRVQGNVHLNGRGKRI